MSDSRSLSSIIPEEKEQKEKNIEAAAERKVPTASLEKAKPGCFSLAFWFDCTRDNLEPSAPNTQTIKSYSPNTPKKKVAGYQYSMFPHGSLNVHTTRDEKGILQPKVYSWEKP